MNPVTALAALAPWFVFAAVSDQTSTREGALAGLAAAAVVALVVYLLERNRGGRLTVVGFAGVIPFALIAAFGFAGEVNLVYWAIPAAVIALSAIGEAVGSREPAAADR